jgi:hypothetical protein
MAGIEYWEGSLKGDCPRKDILMLEDHEGFRKNRKIVHIEKR